MRISDWSSDVCSSDLSRSERYSYIPTATVLQELRGEGFEPFMVCQTRVRHDDGRDYTKHMIRLRHASQINGREANEIILLNSHDGTSSYQMLAGMFRFARSEEHTSELQSLMRISYAVFCSKKKL